MPRLFLAIPLPKTVQQDLAKIREQRSHWPVRWVPTKNLHLTLIFLGDRSVDDIKIISNSIKKNCPRHKLFPLALKLLRDISIKEKTQINLDKMP